MMVVIECPGSPRAAINKCILGMVIDAIQFALEVAELATWQQSVELPESSLVWLLSPQQWHSKKSCSCECLAWQFQTASRLRAFCSRALLRALSNLALTTLLQQPCSQNPLTFTSGFRRCTTSVRLAWLAMTFVRSLYA